MQPLRQEQGVTQGKFFSGEQLVEFRVFFLQDCLPSRGQRAQSIQLSTNSWRRRDGFMPFPRSLARNEKPTTSSWI